MASATSDGPPAPVLIGLVVSYAVAGTLLFCGILGILTWNGVGDRDGVWMTILGLLVLGATYVAWRGSRIGRAFIGLLTAIIAVAGVVYMFTGPGSAFFPSLMVAFLSAATFALLYLPEGSKRFYASA